MHQYKLEVQPAVDFVSNLNDKAVAEFLELWPQIPTFVGPLDLDIRTYCHGLCNLVRGADEWTFEVST